MTLCECGCGQETTIYRGKSKRFIRGHHFRGKSPTPETKKKMVNSHMGIPLSPEHCAAIKNSATAKAAAEAQRGVLKSIKHCAAIKKGQEESGCYEAMRDGNDTVKHHHIYDHGDLSKYIIEMTRSQHTTMHNQMRALNIQVPHINTGHENVEELELMTYIANNCYNTGDS